MKRIVIALALLLIFGGVRLPLEIHLEKLQQAEGFHSAALNLPLRQQLGQMSFIAALSGFRSLVAVILWIEAHEAFQRVEWGRVAGMLNTVTTLQPKSTLYWDMSAWHMAYNASVYALDDVKKEQSPTLRAIEARRYWDIGKKMLENGIENNPDSSTLYASLGRLYADKYEDHLAASKAFSTAAAKPEALPYMQRRAAIELSKVPGQEPETYRQMKALYDSNPQNRVPTLITTLKRLEEKLGIPADQRIKEDNAQ